MTMKKPQVSVGVLAAAITASANWLTIPLDSEMTIRVDGVFSEGEYERASGYPGLLQAKKNRMVPRDGEAILAASPEALYVASMTATEGSETDGGFVTLAKTDGGPVYYDDDFEIFVASEPGGAVTNVYQILVNAANVRFEAARGQKGWKSGAVTACGVRDGFWFMEAKIPWANLPGVDPKKFRFNLARNFVKSGLGYAILTGQGDCYDATRMVSVTAAEGFPGIKVRGMDTSLIAGKYRLTAECAQKGLTLKSECYHKGKIVLRNDPSRDQQVPMEDPYKALSVEVVVNGFGKVFHRPFLPFETGSTVSGGPVTERRRVDGLGYTFLRFYPGASKVAVIADGIGKDDKAVATVVSPDGKEFAAPFAAQPDRTNKAMVMLPKEKDRKAGEWNGRITVTAADGTAKTYEKAFGFAERKFPWQQNRYGYSTKVLAPFTPIEYTGDTLKTVLREHTLGKDGLIAQAKAKGADIFAGPMAFELVSKGEKHAFKPDGWTVFQNEKHGVRTQAKGSFGPFRYVAETVWDYDGFAFVTVKLSPAGSGATIDRLTLKAPLKAEESTLFHAMVDMTRGNPAGLIPTGSGVVWDSSKLIRKKSPLGLPWIPGEFSPYLFVGGEERGLCFVFDSPKGFDLEDGKPMLRIVRGNGTVTAEADVVSRSHAVGEPFEFSFAYQVTPVKPRMPGSERWIPDYGNRLPGMLHYQAIAGASAFGLFPQGFSHLPLNTNHWMYARAYRKAMRQRRIDFDTLAHLNGEGFGEIKAWGEKNADLFNRSYHGSVKRYVDSSKMYIYDDLTREAMTLDRTIPYSCPSIISLTDEAYRYYKAEWSTLIPYHDGMSDRIYLTPSTVDYLVYAYRELLKNGADGINFDEQYVVPQSNPDLSEVRDYKGRCIPEMGILAARNMYKRMAYVLDELGHKERMLAPHLTNTMIIPEFAFATIGVCWEYDLAGNFVEQFPPDYCRAHSWGGQAGLRSVALVLYRDPLRGKIPESQFCIRRNRAFRTAIGLTVQHGMDIMHRYWGDFTEQYRARYVLWAFGTHRADCDFIPYWTNDKPFKATDEKGVRAAKSTAPMPSFETMGNIVPAAAPSFIVGAYRRGSSTLFMITNLGQTGKTTVTYDAKALGLSADCALVDALTGERIAKDGDGFAVDIPECEYRLVFAGPAEFGETLVPPEPDMGYIIK